MRVRLGELHPQYLQAVARLAFHLELQGGRAATEAELLYKEAAAGATQWGAEGDFIALPVGAKLARLFQGQGRLAERRRCTAPPSRAAAGCAAKAPALLGRSRKASCAA